MALCSPGDHHPLDTQLAAAKGPGLLNLREPESTAAPSRKRTEGRRTYTCGDPCRAAQMLGMVPESGANASG